MTALFFMFVAVLCTGRAAAYCVSTYAPDDWWGWETPPNNCRSFVMDRHYNCSAYPGLGLPTTLPNITYLHLGSKSCNGQAQPTGPCIHPEDPTNMGSSHVMGYVEVESPALDFSQATECTIAFEMSNEQDADYFTGNEPNYYLMMLFGAGENPPARAQPWTRFATSYDGRSRIKFRLGNAVNTHFSKDATLFSVRELRLSCYGNITGPNITTECFPDPTPTPTPTPTLTSAPLAGTTRGNVEFPSSSAQESEESVDDSSTACTYGLNLALHLVIGW